MNLKKVRKIKHLIYKGIKTRHWTSCQKTCKQEEGCEIFKSDEKMNVSFKSKGKINLSQRKNVANHCQ